YVDSIWEVKTVLHTNEGDDGRPILFKPHLGIHNYTCIIGGKVDNIYDAFDEVRDLYEEKY
ncbi:MAG: amino acid oxidase, partial [Candidatus Saccharibacteria bacterium]